MSQPRVSVIVPLIHPHPRHFRDAVQSVLDQTFCDFELIIVEDPSPSNGAETLAAFPDSRVVHIQNEKRTSLSEQHNRALATARGELIARFDSDDVCELERLDKEVRFLDSHPDVDVISSQLTIIDDEGRVIGERVYPLEHETIISTMPRMNAIANPAVMFRRKVYERVGGWREGTMLPGQDYEWFSRVARAGFRFANLPERLVRYRMHAGSLKSQRLRETLITTLEVKKTYWRDQMDLRARAIMFAERLLLFVPPRVTLALFKWIRFRSASR